MFNKKNKILLISIVFSLFTTLPVFSSSRNEQREELNTPSQQFQPHKILSEYAGMYQSVMQYIEKFYVDEVPKSKLFYGSLRGIYSTIKHPDEPFPEIIEEDYASFYKGVIDGIDTTVSKEAVFNKITENITTSESQNDIETFFTTSEYSTVFLDILAYLVLNNIEQTKIEEIFTGSMKGMFNSLEDSHSAYLNKAQILDLTDTTEGEFGGLGIHIQKQVVGSDPENKSKELPYVKIISPIHGTPAYRAGIKAGDYITKIEDESTVDLTSDDVLDRLRGKPGTEVTISILRDGTVNFDMTLKRAIIEIPTETHAIIDNIGYLKIMQFTHHSASQIKSVFREFMDNEVDGIVIDVRNNPGGLLSSVVDIAGFIFHGGVVVSTKSRIKSENETLKASRGVIIPEELPIVILVNNGSASASEILTGAIKDRGRGTVIGTKSFGKGSVQQMRMFGEGGFKLTIARFYSPNDITIDKIGIEPDIEVKETTFRDLTEEETITYINLLGERTIGNYLLENKNMTEDMISTFVDSLIESGHDIPKEFLVNDIRHRVNRSKENPPVYDLVHDKPLIKAIEILNKQ